MQAQYKPSKRKCRSLSITQKLVLIVHWSYFASNSFVLSDLFEAEISLRDEEISRLSCQFAAQNEQLLQMRASAENALQTECALKEEIARVKLLASSGGENAGNEVR